MTLAREESESFQRGSWNFQLENRGVSNRGSRYSDRLWRVDEQSWDESLLKSGIADTDVDEYATSQSPERKTPKSFRIYSMHVVDTHHSSLQRSVCFLPVMHPAGMFPRVWSVAMVAFDSTYTAFYVPVAVGFSLAFQSALYAAILDLAAGAIFIFNLAIEFHIGFVMQHNLKHCVIRDGRLVARYYVKEGTFVTDFITTLVYVLQCTFILAYLVDPEGFHLPPFAYQILSAVQFLRLVRLASLIRVSKNIMLRVSTGSIGQIKAIIKPVYVYGMVVLVMLLFLVNLCGCIWFYIGAWYALLGKPNWIASYFAGQYDVQLCHPDHFESDQDCTPLNSWKGQISTWALYISSVYWAVTTMATIGYGDITAQNTGEQVAAVIIMIVGILVFALLIGSIQEVFASATRQARNASKYREKMADVDRWMRKRNLSDITREQVTRFYNEVWLQTEDDSHDALIFKEMPAALRAVVAFDLTNGLIKQVPVLCNLDEQHQRGLVSKLVPISIRPGVDICQEGDDADSVWILQEGTMMSFYADKEGQVEHAPALISETAILADDYPVFGARPCGFRAINSCRLWHLKIRDLRPLQKKYPEIRQILFAGVRQHIVDTYHEVRLSGIDHKDSDWKENAAPSDGEGPTNVIPTLPLTPSKQRWRKAAQHFCLGKYRPVAVEDLDKKMELPGLGRIAVKVLMQLGRFEHEAKDWPPPLPEETGPSPGNELRGIAGNASREKLTSSSNVPPTTDHASNQLLMSLLQEIRDVKQIIQMHGCTYCQQLQR